MGRPGVRPLQKEHTPMQIEVLLSKIHRATVTEANLDYVGSITVDKALLSAAKILPNQKVQVLNVTNGARIETYAIEGAENSGEICINGAAAHIFSPKDIIIIIAYGATDYESAKSHNPTVIFVDEDNRIIS